MTAVAVALWASVATCVAGALLAFRWWLERRPSSPAVGLAERIEQLEAWRMKSELQRLR